MLFDVHSHIVDKFELNQVEHDEITFPDTIKCVVMSAKVSDWTKVALYCDKRKDQLIPAFGLHPWFTWRHQIELDPNILNEIDKWMNHVQSLKEINPQPERDPALHPLVTGKLCNSRRRKKPPKLMNRQQWIRVYELYVSLFPWLNELREFLIRYPNAIVGELGLDKVARIPEINVLVDLNFQWQCFKAQWVLAVLLQRPVSVHCVRIQGQLSEFLIQQAQIGCLPPAIMLHSYSGSIESLRRIQKMPHGDRIYFSYSYVVNGRIRHGQEATCCQSKKNETPLDYDYDLHACQSAHRQRVEEVLRATADDRVLIESDLDDPLQVNRACEAMLQLLARTKSWSMEEAQQKVFENSKTFFDPNLWTTKQLFVETATASSDEYSE